MDLATRPTFLSRDDVRSALRAWLEADGPHRQALGDWLKELLRVLHYATAARRLGEELVDSWFFRAPLRGLGNDGALDRITPRE